MISTGRLLASCWRDPKTVHHELTSHLALLLLLRMKGMHWGKSLASFEIKKKSQGLRGVQIQVRVTANSMLAKEDPEAGRTCQSQHPEASVFLFIFPLNMLSSPFFYSLVISVWSSSFRNFLSLLWHVNKKRRVTPITHLYNSAS